MNNIKYSFEKKYDTSNLDSYQYARKIQSYEREYMMRLYDGTSGALHVSSTVNNYLEDDYVEDYFE